MSDFVDVVPTPYPEFVGVETPGVPGESAYQIWLAAGNTGSRADFLDSLTGPQGPPGADSDGATDPGDLTLIFENKLI